MTRKERIARGVALLAGYRQLLAHPSSSAGASNRLSAAEEAASPCCDGQVKTAAGRLSETTTTKSESSEADSRAVGWRQSRHVLAATAIAAGGRLAIQREEAPSAECVSAGSSTPFKSRSAAPEAEVEGARSESSASVALPRGCDAAAQTDVSGLVHLGRPEGNARCEAELRGAGDLHDAVGPSSEAQCSCWPATVHPCLMQELENLSKQNVQLAEEVRNLQLEVITVTSQREQFEWGKALGAELANVAVPREAADWDRAKSLRILEVSRSVEAENAQLRNLVGQWEAWADAVAKRDAK